MSFGLTGYPANGATAVPTDVVLAYFVPSAAYHAQSGPLRSVTLVHGDIAVSGTTRQPSASHVEFVPDQPLAPNTAYRLRVVWNSAYTAAAGDPSAETTLSFTTGAGPFVGSVQAPVVSLSHYRVRSGLNDSCAPALDNSCFGLPADAWYLSRFVGAEVVELGHGSFMVNMYGEGQGHPNNCMELRARAPNGQLSSATTVCVTDGPLYDLTRLAGNESLASLTCTAQGLKWKDQLVSQQATGAAPKPYTGGLSGDPINRESDVPWPPADKSVSAPVAFDTSPEAGLGWRDAPPVAASSAAGADSPDAAAPQPTTATTTDFATASGQGAAEGEEGGCSVGRSSQRPASLLIELGALAAWCLRRRRRSRA